MLYNYTVMINALNTLKNMKKTIILVVFALMLLSIPQKTQAFQLERLIDPACLFACDNGGSKTVTNVTTNNTSVVTTNSNNVTTTNNNPASTPTPTIPNRPPTNHYSNDNYHDSNYHESDYYPTYIPAPQRPIQVYTRPPTPIYVYNDNYNYNYPNYNDYNNNYNQYNQLGVSCYSTYQQGNVGDIINWRASAYGGNGNYYITWTGTDGLYGNGSSISTTYNYPGTKIASVTVNSGGQSITQNCNSVQISGNYNTNIYASCSTNTTYAQIGGQVVWQAYVSGGTGAYTYNWYGTDNLNGYGQNIDTYYNTPGLKTAYVVVRSGNQSATAYCTNNVIVSGYTPLSQYPTYPPVYTPPQPQIKNTNTTIIKYVTVAPPKVEVASTTLTPTPTQTPVGPTTISIPWGWISFLVIIILVFTVVYLIFAKRKI